MATFRKHFPDLAKQITDSITDFSNRLSAEKLLDQQVCEDILSITSVGNLDKATRLLRAVQRVLEGKRDPSVTFVKLCEILCRYESVKDIAETMLNQAGML